MLFARRKNKNSVGWLVTTPPQNNKNMEALKDYKRKQDELRFFFIGLPKQPINEGMDKDRKSVTFSTNGYNFKKVCRREFDGIWRNAEDLHSACIPDEVSIEDDIALNAEKIDVIRKMVSDFMKYPKYNPKENLWLKSLLDAGIIEDWEFNSICGHIESCAETMKENVRVMKHLLDKYDKPQPPKDPIPIAIQVLFRHDDDLAEGFLRECINDPDPKNVADRYKKLEREGKVVKHLERGCLKNLFYWLKPYKGVDKEYSNFTRKF